MGRKRTVRAVLITLILTLVVVGGLVFFFGNKIISEKDQKIKQLEDKISPTKAYAFSRDIKAGNVITPDDIVLIDILNASRTSGMFLENSKTWTDAEGNVHKYADHYIKDENGNEATIPVIIDDEIVGRTVKANISEKTPVIDALLYAKGEIPEKDERIEEFNYITLPSTLYTGDFCDIRLQFAGGEDFVVLVGKRVEAVAGDTTIFLKLNEDDIMLMASATIEAFINTGASLYATKYTEPAAQLYTETIEDYVAKYDYGVEKALEAKDLDKILALMQQSGDADIYTYEAMTDEERNALKSRIIPTKLEDLTNADIAQFAGIKEEHVRAIREAKEDDKETSDVLTYYRNMRVQRRNEIERTYAVREDVLKVINANPNLVDQVKSWFAERYDTNTRLEIVSDKYKQLEKEYATAPEYDYNGSGIRTKKDVAEDMKTELEKRAKDVDTKRENDLQERNNRRKAYLDELINGSSSSNN